MSRRSPGRSVIGLIVEIGIIVLVVTLLPKLDLRPKAADWSQTSALPLPAAESQAPNHSQPWWQATPSAAETSWQAPKSRDVNVEQTLNAASRQLLSGVGDYTTRAAAELIQPPPAPQLIDAQPREWTRY